MKTESYYAGIYWPARLESAEECARRTETFFRLLAPCDEIFGRWYEQADSAEEALQRGFTPNDETLLRFYRTEENQLSKDGFLLSVGRGLSPGSHAPSIILKDTRPVRPRESRAPAGRCL